jgi:hypothetical protein
VVIGFTELLQNLATSNYSANYSSHPFTHSAVHNSTYEIFSVYCIYIGCRLVTVSNAVASSASVFTYLLAGDCLTTTSLFQMTNYQAGGYLTPNSYSSSCRPAPSRNSSCSSLHSIVMDRIVNTASNSSIDMYVCCGRYMTKAFVYRAIT